MGSPLRYHLTFALGSDTKHSITASFLLVTEYFSGSFCVKKYSGSLAEKWLYLCEKNIWKYTSQKFRLVVLKVAFKTDSINN